MAVPVELLEDEETLQGQEEEIPDEDMVMIDHDPMEMALSVADDLADICALQAVILSNTYAARPTLGVAAGLLCEDIDATEAIVAHAFTLVPARYDPVSEAALTAAAMLVARVFSEAPLLPGAVGAARELIASICGISPPGCHCTLRDAVAELDFSELAEVHDTVGDLFVACGADLGIQQGDETWRAWSNHKDIAIKAARKTEVRLRFAMKVAMKAVHVQGGERMREAWKMKQAVSTVMRYVDLALVTILLTRDAVAAQEDIVRKVIVDAAP